MTDDLSRRRAARRREAALRLTRVRARLRWSPGWEVELRATGRWWYVVAWLVLLPLGVAGTLLTTVARAWIGDVRTLALYGIAGAVTVWHTVTLARRRAKTSAVTGRDEEGDASPGTTARQATLALARIRARLQWSPHWEAEIRATGRWWCIVAWIVLALFVGAVTADVLRTLLAWAWTRDTRMLALCGAAIAAATWRAIALTRSDDRDDDPPDDAS